MELLLIRHALPIRRELTEGVADPELSEAGVAQALHLAEYLASEELHAIYASPLKRAQQTAAPIAERFQLEVTLVDGVAEFDRNSSEYVPVEELKATNDPRWQELIDNRWDGRDETQQQFTDRVFNSLEAVIDAHTGHNVAVVCHGGVINSYLARILGTPETSGFFYPNYTSIHRVVAARTGQRQIVTINETAHLRGTGLPIGLYGK